MSHSRAFLLPIKVGTVDRDEMREEPEVILSTRVDKALLNLVTVNKILSTVLEMHIYLTLLMRITDPIIRFQMTLTLQQIGHSTLIPISTISVKPVNKVALTYF